MHESPPGEPPASRAMHPLPVSHEPVPLAALRQIPFFAPLPDNLLSKLQPHLRDVQYDTDDLILRMGEYSDAAYYIREGAVEVRLTSVSSDAPATASSQAARHAAGLMTDLTSDAGSPTRVVLVKGEIFGEMGALSRYPVSADVVATEPTTCLVIRTQALRLLLKQADLVWFRQFVDERYRSRALASHLRGVSLLEGLDDDQIERLRQRAELMAFDPGTQIVAQGTAGDALYLVRGGYVKVAVQSGSADLAVTYLRRGDYAGEIPLLTDQPWPFSLQALEHVEIVRLPRADVLEVVRANPEVERRLRDSADRRLTERRLALERPGETRILQRAMDTGLINGESVLLIDLETCTRCDDCVRACADEHAGTPRFVREGPRVGRWSVPHACYQCSDPVCMIGCPTGAISRPLGSFEVTIDADTCIGCHNCVRRCPWGNIIEVPFNSPALGKTIELATKCDLCIGRPAGPACVEACPHGSAVRLSFKNLDTVVRTLSR